MPIGLIVLLVWLAGMLLTGLFITLDYPVEKRNARDSVFISAVLITGALWFIFVPRWIIRRIG